MSDHAVEMIIDCVKWCFWFVAVAIVVLAVNGFFDKDK